MGRIHFLPAPPAILAVGLTGAHKALGLLLASVLSVGLENMLRWQVEAAAFATLLEENMSLELCMVCSK